MPETHKAIEAGRVASDTKHGVATITFFHPKSNSLPGPLLAGIAAAVDAASRDDSARVIVLRSEGDGAFCAGASFSELKAVRDVAGGKTFFLGFARLILAMVNSPKFVITRVHGKTVGGGVGVVAASDYAIAARTASVRLSELAVGIGPFVVGPVIQRKVGFSAFSALGVDAGWRDAAWAERHGLYSEVHDDPASLDRAVDDLARRLAGSNPEAMAEMKTIFRKGTEDWDSLLSLRAEISGRLVLSDFARKAIAAAG